MNMIKNNSFSSLRSFLRLWASQSVSAMGTAMTNYALVIWVYGQDGTASSITNLTLCSFLPTILFRIFAGAAADRWDKKRIMLLCDLAAACGTAIVFALYATSSLKLAHLYAINVLLSFMNAFQVPAAYVATSLLTPKEHYQRAGGLHALSSAFISILSPVLGAIVLAWGGMEAVLTIDLVTFAVAFLTLWHITVPKPEADAKAKQESVWQSCLTGLHYLKEHPQLLGLIIYIAAVNLLAKLGPDGLLPAFVLSRTGGDQTILGAVQSSVALGLMAGGALATLTKPAAHSPRAIFRLCCLIFLSGFGLALSRNAALWCAAVFLQYLFAALMNVHWNTLMRSAVPPALQGRVYSARDTLQNCTIPLGLYAGGMLADHIFEPWMASSAALPQALTPLLGEGGAGIAVQFFLTALVGLFISAVCMNRKVFQSTHHASDDTFPKK